MAEKISRRDLTSWSGDEYEAPRVDDVVYGEFFAADLADALEEARDGKTEKLMRLNDAYQLMPQPLDADDVQDWMRLGEAMTSWSEDGLNVAMKLIEKGVDPEKMIKLTFKAKVAEKQPVEVQGNEPRTAEMIADDLIIVSKKKGEVSGEVLKQARQNLLDDGADVRTFLYGGLNVKKNVADRAVLQERRDALMELADAIKQNSVGQNEKDLLEKIGLDPKKIGVYEVVKKTEQKKATLKEVVDENDERYNEIFLNTNRDKNTPLEDDAERFHGRYLLELAGYDIAEINELDDKVREGLARGDMSSLDILFAKAQMVYLSVILGANDLKDYASKGRQIEALIRKTISATKETQSLWKELIVRSTKIAEARGWGVDAQDRLVNTLENLFLAGGKMKEAKKDKFAVEYELDDPVQREIVRGIIIDKIAGAYQNTSEDSILSAVLNDYRTYKGVGQQYGVFSPEATVELKIEISARLNLHQVEMAWLDIKNDFQTEADAYVNMKGRLKGMPVLAESTYKWLFQGYDASGGIKADAPDMSFRSPLERDVKVETKNLSVEVSNALAKIYEEMMTLDGDGKPTGKDFWTVVTPDDRDRYFRALGITNSDVGRLAMQIIEAEMWSTERKKTAHPARRLVEFSASRKEKFEASGAAPGGIRLIQEYFDKNPNATLKDIPDNVFDPEQKKWARNGLDMVYGYGSRNRDGVRRGDYLRDLMLRKDSSEFLTQEVMRTELSKAASVFDSFEPIGKPPVTAESGALQKLKVMIFIWWVYEESIGMAGPGESSLSMVSGGRGEKMMPFVSRLNLEYTKSAVWTNSLANTKNSKPMPMHELYTFFESVVTDHDPLKQTPGVVGLSDFQAGTELVKKKEQVRDMAEWFNVLWFNKCFVMLDKNKAPNAVPWYLRRSDLASESIIKLKKDAEGIKHGYSVRSFMNNRNGWWNQ